MRKQPISCSFGTVRAGFQRRSYMSLSETHRAQHRNSFWVRPGSIGADTTATTSYSRYRVVDVRIFHVFEVPGCGCFRPSAADSYAGSCGSVRVETHGQQLSHHHLVRLRGGCCRGRCRSGLLRELCLSWLEAFSSEVLQAQGLRHGHLAVQLARHPLLIHKVPLQLHQEIPGHGGEPSRFGGRASSEGKALFGGRKTSQARLELNHRLRLLWLWLAFSFGLLGICFTLFCLSRSESQYLLDV
mmetsp:Transcript_65072/g.105210  ORF Transcript_65072/g.105210 Transcript_65072/m.105210 type:complete len:243 (-) Transcript_65072:1653-2381(-)